MRSIARGITHRDLKPANVLLDGEVRPHVLNFGLAQMIEPSTPDDATVVAVAPITQEGMVIGTIGYMSPEPAQGQEVDHRTDIFSSGVILYQLATGRMPFAGDSNAAVLSSILRDDPAPVSDVRATLPGHLGRIVKRCLEKDPGERYRTARELSKELRDLREELTVD